MDGFIPVKPDEINFLDVTNDGLVVGRSPNGESEQFVDYVVEKATKLLKEHEEPPTPEFDVVCSILNQNVTSPFFWDLIK